LYTDPGIVSMVIAAAIGFLIAIPAYFVFYKKKIGRGFNRNKRERTRQL